MERTFIVTIKRGDDPESDYQETLTATEVSTQYPWFASVVAIWSGPYAGEYDTCQFTGFSESSLSSISIEMERAR
jgi:hypothetical protein